jgi:hypothetical protein
LLLFSLYTIRCKPINAAIYNRRSVHQDTGRVGAHFKLSPHSDGIVSLLYSELETNDRRFFGEIDGTPLKIDTLAKDKGYQLEAQYLFRTGRFNLIAGLGTYDIDVNQQAIQDDVIPLSIPSGARKQDIAYIYSNINWPEKLIWTAGLSYDAYQEFGFDLVDAVNPKLGLQWDLTDALRLRVAYMKTVKRALIVDQTIEPTQVAGFNQFFDDLNGTRAIRYGIGFDARLSERLNSGVEVSRRDLNQVPHLVQQVGSEFVFENEDFREDLYRAYLAWIPHQDWAVNAAYQFETFKLEKRISLEPPPLAWIQ